MKGNVWLAGYIVLSLLVIGGAGFFALKEHGGYRERFEGWNSRTENIKELEEEVPTPTKANQERFETELTTYEDKVAALFDSLNQFQKPLDTTLKLTEFQKILKKKVDDFTKLAIQSGVDISRLDKNGPFFMGMEDYRTILPKQDATPLLAYQLDAIERILGHLVDSEMDKIIELNREKLPAESDDAGNTPGAASEVVQKYPIQFRFEGSHPAFRGFINRLANDKDYFFSLRVLRVENSAPDGPGTTNDPTSVQYIDKEGIPVPQEVVERELGGLTKEEIDIKLEVLEWTPVRQDAAILFGKEFVKVFAVIDMVRFVKPEEAEAEEETEVDGDSGNS